MALTSALFTGLSGLDVNQGRLGVVANNIANANTVAFKSSRALFKPQFYVTDDAGTPPSDDFGGTNPNQRGLGAALAAIEKDFSVGSIDPTGRATDLALDGDGFFVLDGQSRQFTRDGSFSLNAANELVTTDGQFVQGFGADAEGNVVRGSLKKITVPLGASTNAKATGKVTLEGNLNAAGDAGTGASILTSQLLTTVGGGGPPTAGTLLTNLASASANATPLLTAGETLTIRGIRGGREVSERTFAITAASTVGEMNDFFRQSLGIDATVPDDADADALTPAPGVAVEADAADPNAGRLVITGNLGKDNALSLAGAALLGGGGKLPFAFADGANAAGIASAPAGESVHTSFVGFDSLGTPVTVDVTAVLESKTDDGNVWRFYANSGDDTDADTVLGNGTLTFDGEGKLKAITGDILNVDRAQTGAKSPLAIKVDFSGMTSLTSRNSGMVMTQQDGSQIGALDGFSIGADGTIMGAYSNGQSQKLGQVAVARFANNMGLVDRGANKFVAGPDSGEPVIAAATEMGTGAIRSGALEQSNVDLSQEFINLIISSTGFSAASRVITTSDRLITELLNSSR